MTTRITAAEIHNLVNTYLRTPANAYVLKDENKATLVEYNRSTGDMDYPGTPLPFSSSGTALLPNELNVKTNVTHAGLISQLQRWALLYSRVRYCKFEQQISGGASATVQTYFKYCSFVTFPGDYLTESPLINAQDLSTNSGIEYQAGVNIKQNVTDALTYMLPTLQQYWTDPAYGKTFSFCHSSCHSSCHGSRNRR